MNLIEQPDLSIIIVNWNSLELTSHALASLKEKAQGINYEVFVIDNGTTKDSSVDELPRRFPWIKFIANSDNLGFSKANNQGIRESRGRYVLLLNNDTIQIENALGESVKYMDAHPEVGALGILHLNNDAEKTFQPSFFNFPRPWSEILGLFGLKRHAPPAPPSTLSPSEQDVDWICGSFLLMRRECLAQVGELDERFFIYDEDIDWCLQAHQAGWKVRYWPQAAMIHLGAAARPFMKDKTFVHFRSHLSYIRKNQSQLAAALYYLAMGARLGMATVKQGLRYFMGRATVEELRERYTRQRQFLGLRSGRAGG
jgi:GT2 family glycosyltransferase